MRFASLGSGSKGNATIVESQGNCILVDCGFGLKETIRRLQKLGKTPEDIKGIFVTHEHSDHYGGVEKFSNRFDIPVYLTQGTLRAAKKIKTSLVHKICPQSVTRLVGFDIKPVLVPHDAHEPVQYVVSSAGKKLGVLSDLGCITSYVEENYRDCDALVLECNHDQDMLALGPYPESLKRRVAGDWGHLNNSQAAALLQTVDREKVQHLVICHVSEKNNSLSLAMEKVTEVFEQRDRITCSLQNEGHDWLAIE